MADESCNDGKVRISWKTILVGIVLATVAWGSWLSVEVFHRATASAVKAVEMKNSAEVKAVAQKVDTYIRLDTSRYTEATAQRARIMAIQEMILKRLDTRGGSK